MAVPATLIAIVSNIGFSQESARVKSESHIQPISENKAGIPSLSRAASNSPT